MAIARRLISPISGYSADQDSIRKQTRTANWRFCQDNSHYLWQDSYFRGFRNSDISRAIFGIARPSWEIDAGNVNYPWFYFIWNLELWKSGDSCELRKISRNETILEMCQINLLSISRLSAKRPFLPVDEQFEPLSRRSRGGGQSAIVFLNSRWIAKIY